MGISDGKISRRVMQPTPTSVQRVTKEGKTVHEEFYRGWTGRIVDIKTRENDYGKQWMVHLQDEDGLAILQMPYSSGYSAAFLKVLPNVDFTQDVTIVPSLKIEGDKKKTALFVSQNGQALKWFYTKDNPNGIPDLKRVRVKGKDTWDDSDIMEFLEDMVNTIVLPRIEAAKAEDEKAPF